MHGFSPTVPVCGDWSKHVEVQVGLYCRRPRLRGLIRQLILLEKYYASENAVRGAQGAFWNKGI